METPLEEQIAAIEHEIERGEHDPVALGRLSLLYRRLWLQERRPADMATALQLAERAVSTSSSGDPMYAALLASLGQIRRAAFLAGGGAHLLDQAVSDVEHAVGQAHGDARIPDIAATMCEVLRTKAEHSGGLREINRAIGWGRFASRRAPAGTATERIAQSNLSGALRDRFRITGRIEDIHEGVEAAERALETAGRDLAPEELARHINAVGVALSERYLAAGELLDLHQAAEAFRDAASTTTLSADLPVYLTNAAVLFHDIYTNTGDRASYGEAIRDARDAVRLTDPGDVLQAGRQANLASILSEHPDREVDRAPLDEAIMLYEASLATSEERPDRRNNLSSTLLERHRLYGDRTDLDRASELAMSVVETISPDSADAPPYLFNHALCSARRFDVSGDPVDEEVADHAFEQAIAAGARNRPGTALRAARDWGLWAGGYERWDVAARALAMAGQQRQVLHESQATRGGSETWLAVAAGAANEEGYARAKLDEYENALAAIEQGRVVLATAQLRLAEADLEALEDAGHGEFAGRFRLAAARILRGPRDGATKASAATEIEIDAESRAALRAVIQDIRALPGFEVFLLTASNEELERWIGNRAVVYMVPARLGGLLLARDSSRRFRCRFLDELTLDAVADAADAYLAAQKDPVDPGRWSKALSDNIDWLLRTCVRRVAGLMNRTDPWCVIPVGPVALLPVHAALDVAADNAVNPSYDFSIGLSAQLLHAASGVKVNDRSRVLLIDDPTESLGSWAAVETRVVNSHFPGRRLLAGKAATRSAVVEALEESYDVVHFSCHGYLDPARPLESSLDLADGRLSLETILQRGPIRAGLVVLSACETGQSGSWLPDELVGFPAGMLAGGTGGVIATAFAVSTDAAAAFVAEFYNNWRTLSMSPSRAAGVARHRMRTAEGSWRPARWPEDAPSVRSMAAVHDWAGFVYYGP